METLKVELGMACKPCHIRDSAIKLIYMKKNAIRAASKGGV